MMMTIDIDQITLEKGAHQPDDGVCVMELAARMAGEKHSDHPACVCPVLGAFLRCWNDSTDDDFRQKLKPFAIRVIGTAGDGKREARAWMATDWLVRVCAPAWLDLCKLTEHAMALRTADALHDTISAENIQPLLNVARRDSAAAWDAAWDVARAAARAAANAAAWAAAWAAARAAAWAAAWAAARDALKPTVESLQASALELLDRMIQGEF